MGDNNAVRTQLQLSSGDRISGTTSSYTVHLVQPICNIKRIVLVYARFASTFLPKGTINFVDTSGTHTLSTPTVYYSPTDFFTWMQTTLNSLSSQVYTITYDSVQDKVTIAINTGTFAIAWSNNLVRDWLNILGLDPFSTYTGLSTVTSSGLCTFAYSSIRLFLKGATANTSGAKYFAAQFTLPATFVYFFWNTQTETTLGYQAYIDIGQSGFNLSDVSLEFRDLQDNLIDLQGTPNDFVFRIEYY